MTGAIFGIFVAMIVIWVITKRKLKQAIVGLLKDTPSNSNILPKRKNFLNYVFMLTGYGGSFVLVIYSLINSMNLNAGMFLTAGALFILGAISSINYYFNKQNSTAINSLFGIFKLAIKNAGRNKARSLTTISLLALGTFTIVITGANRKTFYGADSNKQSGTGGFGFWAESSLPVIYDLNTQEGKNKYGLADEDVLVNTEFVAAVYT